MINVGSGKATKVREIVDIVLGNWPSNRRVLFNGQNRPGDPFSLIADPAQFSATGLSLRIQVEAGVRDYVRWYLRGNGETL